MQPADDIAASSRPTAGPLEPWTIREKLCLASAVRHNGEQNWMSVSKAMRPFLDPHRPPERFAQKNCAMQYAELLENVDPPKRVKRGDSKETSEDIVVRKLTYQRIEELKKIVAAEKEKFMELKRKQEMLKKGLLDEKLPEMWAEVVAKKRAAEEAEAALKAANEEAARAAKDAMLMQSEPEPSLTSPEASPLTSPIAKTTEISHATAIPAEISQTSSENFPEPSQSPVKQSLITQLLLSDTIPVIPVKETEPATEPVAIVESEDDISQEKTLVEEEPIAPSENLDLKDEEQVLETASLETNSDKLTGQSVEDVSEEPAIVEIGTVAESKSEEVIEKLGDIKTPEEEVKMPEKSSLPVEPSLHDSLETILSEPGDLDHSKPAAVVHEVTLEDIEKIKFGGLKDDLGVLTKTTDGDEVLPDLKKGTEDDQFCPILEDSGSEAEAELEGASDLHGTKAHSLVSGASPSESETEDTFSNAASPRGDGRRIRTAGSEIGSSIAGPSSSYPNSPASISQSSDIEADEKAHRAWKKSIMLVWRNASHHRYANLFTHPVTDEIAPGYSVVIKRPMDLKSIKSRVDNGQIMTTAEFQRDMMLMFTNAIMYNNSDQDIFHMTNEMYRDVREDIDQFVSTQLMVQATQASINTFDSVSSPVVASSSRLRGRASRAQKQQDISEEADIEGKTSTPAAKRKGTEETVSKSKKRRSQKID